MEKIKVLIIDDHRMTLDVINDILFEEGCYDIYAYQLVPSISVIKTINPDIILLDIILHQYDGRDIVKILKKFLKHTQIILMSAYVDTSSSALAAGANAFLKKPFDIDDLIRIVDKCASMQRKSPTCE